MTTDREKLEMLRKAARVYVKLAHEIREADYKCSRGCECRYCKAHLAVLAEIEKEDLRAHD